MKRNLFLVLVMLLTLHAHGQETKLSAVDSIRLKTGRKSVANLDIRVPIIKTLTKHMMENNDAFWNKPTDVPYLIAIALSFDSSGTVEDIFFLRAYQLLSVKCFV